MLGIGKPKTAEATREPSYVVCGLLDVPLNADARGFSIEKLKRLIIVCMFSFILKLCRVKVVYLATFPVFSVVLTLENK